MPSTIFVTKEWIGTFLKGYLFHVKLCVFNPESFKHSLCFDFWFLVFRFLFAFFVFALAIQLPTSVACRFYDWGWTRKFIIFFVVKFLPIDFLLTPIVECACLNADHICMFEWSQKCRETVWLIPHKVAENPELSSGETSIIPELTPKSNISFLKKGFCLLLYRPFETFYELYCHSAKLSTSFVVVFCRDFWFGLYEVLSQITVIHFLTPI